MGSQAYHRSQQSFEILHNIDKKIRLLPDMQTRVQPVIGAGQQAMLRACFRLFSKAESTISSASDAFR